MTDSALTRKTTGAGDNLQLLMALAREIERAIDAIGANRLDEFEDSVAIQGELSSQIGSHALRPTGDVALLGAAGSIEPALAAKLRAAAISLQQLNKRYAVLLSASSQTVAQMSSLFQSYRGHITQHSSAGLKRQTASWQV